METNSPDPRIIRFIRKHHVMTIATCSDGQPWCANMFYAYDDASGFLVFTSDAHTRHVAEIVANGKAAGSIVLETKVVGRLQGLQLSGTIRKPAQHEEGSMRKAYLTRFPYAAMADLNLWIFAPDYLKYTDNTLGFGKKLFWEKEKGETKKA